MTAAMEINEPTRLCAPPLLSQKGAVHGRRDLAWDGLTLRLGTKAGRVLATVEPDAEWPGLWRVRTPDGRLSGIVNPTRAKDAALSLALAALNRPDREAA
jgi:hypothetical protein